MASTYSRMALRGRLRSTPTLAARGSHQAPRPQRMRPGATSSRVAMVCATRAALRVHVLITPEPILIRSVTAAKAAMGGAGPGPRAPPPLPHRLEPAGLGVAHVLHPLPDGMLVLQVQRDPPSRHASAFQPPADPQGFQALARFLVSGTTQPEIATSPPRISMAYMILGVRHRLG